MAIKTVAERIESATKVVIALTGLVGVLGGLDAAVAKRFGRDSLLFQATGVGVQGSSPSPPVVPDTTNGNATAEVALNTTRPTPPPLPPLIPTRFAKPDGEFVKRGTREWVEVTNGQDGPTFQERDVREGQIVLWDDSRKMYLRLPVDGGIATWSFANPLSWTNLFYVSPQGQDDRSQEPSPQ